MKRPMGRPKLAQEVPPGMKWCTGCDTAHPATVECFGRNKSRPDGLGHYCRACQSLTLQNITPPAILKRRGLPPVVATPKQPKISRTGQRVCNVCKKWKKLNRHNFRRMKKNWKSTCLQCKPFDPNHPPCSKCGTSWPRTSDYYYCMDADRGLRPECILCTLEEKEKRDDRKDPGRIKRRQERIVDEYLKKLKEARQTLVNLLAYQLSEMLREKNLKQCSKCKMFKSATSENFVQNNRRPDGLGSHCKTCHNAYTIAWYHANKQAN